MKTARYVFAFILFSIIYSSFQLKAQDALYAVGPFNGWNAKLPYAFERDGDIYSLILDFTDDNEFKMSTISGAGAEGNGWYEFDQGALKPVDNPKLDEWVGIKPEYRGNIQAPGHMELKVEVNLETMEMRFSNVAPVTFSGTLPVIFINTENLQPITSKDTYLQATYWLDPCATEDVEAIGSQETPLPLQIRGRGNWTWTGFKKKPYRLKLGEKAPLAGLTKSKHFVLLAHADDTVGFMRNTLGFASSSLIGMPWTPEQRPVEVVLNGEYIGLYFLTENVRVDKNRVNVTEQEDYATAEVDGGWLVEIDNYDADPHVTVFEGSYPIWFTYKSPEFLSNEQHNFLFDEMQAIQNAISSKDYDSFSRLVDVDVLARYYIVQEMMNDYESFHGSCFLWRQRGENEKWNFGPVWDFGSALFSDDNNWIYNSIFHQVWIEAIVSNFPRFNERVKSIWFEFLNEGGEGKLLEEGEAFASHISEAAVNNFRRWPEYGNRVEMESAEVAFNRLKSKINWLREKWGAPSGLSELESVPIRRVYCRDGLLHVFSSVEERVTLVSPTGLSRSVHLKQGDNEIYGFPSGIYFLVPSRNIK